MPGISDTHITTATLLLCLVACSRNVDAPAPVASASGDPVDRLAPEELLPGEDRVFGLRVPKGMTVTGRFTKVAYLGGSQSPEAVANYIREQVVVDRVEIGAASTVFPRAFIKGDASKTVYRIEVVPKFAATRVIIRDLTPDAPSQAGKALRSLENDEQRWKHIGRNPDGTLRDRLKME